MTKSLHLIIEGRVQGVAFRFFTQKQAKKLNVTGYVKNLADGSVEIIAQGEPIALQSLVDWCHQGPTSARVSKVSVTAQLSTEIFADFEIR